MNEKNSLRRFLFEEMGIRGEWLKLTESWQETIQHQQLSEGVMEQLGQALAASVLLSATIKFEGTLILQAQGKGPLTTLVAHTTHDKKVRALARGDTHLNRGSIGEMMGEGRLVITIEPTKGEPYQGIVSLQESSLSDAITSYFSQSEQLKTGVWLFANKDHIAGLLIQQLPTEKNIDQDWEHLMALINTVTQQEMFDLGCEEMLHRLFHEEKVRLFDSEAIKFQCSCSRHKIENTLISIGRKELEDILVENETIDVNCEFCAAHYSFDKVDIENLLSGQSLQHTSQMKH